MKVFMISRKGTTVSGQVSMMLVTARNSAEAAALALGYSSPNKEGFKSGAIDIKEITLDQPQIVLIQSL